MSAPLRKLHSGHEWVSQQLKDQAKIRKHGVEIVGWFDDSDWGQPDAAGISSIKPILALTFEMDRKRETIRFPRALVDDCADEHQYDQTHRAQALTIIKTELDG